MKFFRRLRLVVVPACLCALSVSPALLAQQPPRLNRLRTPQQQTPPADPAEAAAAFETTQPRRNPRRTRRATPSRSGGLLPRQTGQRPQLETPKPAAAPPVKPTGRSSKPSNSAAPAAFRRTP